MTFGLIIGCIITFLAFIVFMDSYNGIIDTIISLMGSMVIGLIAWGIAAVICASTIYCIYHNRDDFYTTTQTEQISIEGAKIDSLGKSNTTYLIYTDADNLETNHTSTHFVKLHNVETDEPYIIIKQKISKGQFFTHILNYTEYEYYGIVKDLYR